MADPISVVGLVAGLASLGIQVYGGITDYLDAVKCCADDVASVRRYAQSFKNVLQVIQTTVTQVDSNHQVSTTAVMECIKSCETELKTLETFVSELTGDVISPANFKGKIKEQTRKLSYAFNRSKLDQLVASLARANGIFRTAVQSLGLGIWASANKTLGAISTELLVVRSEVAVLNDPLAKVNDSLPTIQRLVDALPPLLAQNAESLSTQLYASTQEIRDELQQLQNSFRTPFVSNRDQLDRIEQSLQTFDQSSRLAGMERMLGELVIQGATRNAQAQHAIVSRLVAKPSSLKALCNEVAAPFEEAQAGLKGPSRQFETLLLRGSVTGSGTNCICRRRRRYQQQRLRLGALELYDETTLTEEHLPDCQISQVLPRHRHRSLGVKYTGAIRLLDKAVNMAFSMTFGAGGFSIAPVFTYYATVDDQTAPAFQILDILDKAIGYLLPTAGRDWNMLTETALKKILKLFRERRSSPTDVDSMNGSLLHLAGNFTRRSLVPDHYSEAYDCGPMSLAVLANDVEQHTCCKEWWLRGAFAPLGYDFEEIREVEEEQAALLKILEDLVEEFEGKSMGILEETTETLASLGEFWTGYWCERLENVLEDLNSATISDEERLAAERIGVRWYDKPDEGPDEEDKSDIRYWYRRIDEIA
ncbi:hypothetical protein DL769_006129 [Monosporascus sp. CRB-8-3]|nr:hypothetical protein DL769_006129 [Monosporascus sp. CRB-8-3]